MTDSRLAVALRRQPHSTPTTPAWVALAFASVVVLPPGLAAPIAELRKLEGTAWYSVSLANQRVGWAYSKTELDDSAANGPLLRVTERMAARVKLGGDGPGLSVSTEAISVYDASLRLQSLTMHSNELGRERDITVQVRDGNVEMDIEAGGDKRHETIPIPENSGSELPLMLAIIAGTAKVGDKVEFEQFSPDMGAFDHFTTTITGRETLKDGREGWVIKSVGTRLPMEIITLVAPDGVVVSQRVPAMLNMTRELVTEDEALKEAAPLVLSPEIAVNTQLGDPRKLDMLKVRITAGDQNAAELVPATSRQDIQPEGKAVIATIRRIKPQVPAATIPVNGEEFAAYLRPSERAQMDDPAIVKQAREIVGDESDARKAAEKIVLWVFERLKKKASEPRPMSAKEVLQAMEGDCTEHATLCAALAGAAGIPAKFCAGIAYLRGSFFYHAWNELYVGEWVEMDPAWGETALDAAHIRLASGALDGAAMAQMSFMAGRSLGVLGVEVLDWAPKPGATEAAP